MESFNSTRLWLKSIIVFFLFFAGSNRASAQNDFRQAANDNGAGLGVVKWLNGIVQQNNSRYFEGMSVPQRVIFLGLSGSNHTLTMSHQSVKASNNSHAYDFVTSWDQAVAAAGIYTNSVNLLNTMNQCADAQNTFITACNSAHTNFHIDIPVPSGLPNSLGDDVNTRSAAYEAQFGPRFIRIWGDQPFTAGSMVFTGYVGGDLDASYNINWTSTSPSVVIEFATHISNGVDPFFPGTGYGAGRGAGAISGGPYHVSLGSIDGASTGSQDNQLKGGDILTIVAPTCSVSGPSAICASANSASFTGSVTNAPAGSTYEISLSPNTANAVLSTTATGAYAGPVSLGIAPGAGGFTAGGSVTINFVLRNSFGVLLTQCNATLQINALPAANAQSLSKCDEGNNQATFNLTALASAINGGTGNAVTFFTASDLNAGSQINTPSAFVSGSTTVYAKVVNSNTTCVNSAAITLTVNPKPNCTVNGPSSACAGATGLVFSSAVSGLNYVWNVTGGTITLGAGTDQITVTAGNAGTMNVQLTISNGNCSSTCSKNVTVNAVPAALVLTGSAICTGAPNTGTITSGTSATGFNYQLYDGSNVAVQAAQAGTGSGLTWSNLPAGNNYHVVGTGVAPTNCNSTSNNVNVVAVQNPAALVLTGSSICSGAPNTGTVTSSGSATGVSYQLYDGSNNTVQAAKPGTGTGLTWSNLPAGTNYHVVSSVSSPITCTSTSNNVAVTTVQSPIALVLLENAICSSAPNSGTISSTTSQTDISYQLYSGANVALQAPKNGTGSALTWSGLAAGVGYYVIGTTGSPANCISTSNHVDILSVPDPVALVLTGSAICASAPNTGTITSSTSVATVSYQLYNGSNVTVQSAQVGTGSGLTWSNLPAGTNYHVVGTNAAVINCSSTSNNVNVTNVANPTPLNLTGSVICQNNPIAGTITSSSSQPGVSYQLYDLNENPLQAPKTGTGGVLTWSGLFMGNGYFVIGTGAAPTNCTSQSSPVNIIIGPCVPACTYTQGYYGNAGGISCNGTGVKVTTMQRIVVAMGDGIPPIPGYFRFGSTATNRYFDLYLADTAHIFDMLPGGTTPQIFGAGGASYANHSTWSRVPMQGSGKIRNVLFAQTLTLFLNLHSSPQLGTIPFNDTLVTMKPLFCGSSTPTGSADTFSLPHAIVVYLHNPFNGYTADINGLFQLANDVLGGANTNFTPSQMNDAVDKINNAFDGCKILVSSLTMSLPLGVPSVSTQQPLTATTTTTDPNYINVEVSAVPNPFRDRVSFVIRSGVTGNAKLELFDLSGRSVATVFQGQIQKNGMKTISYTPTGNTNDLFIYRLTVDGKTVTGKVVHFK